MGRIRDICDGIPTFLVENCWISTGFLRRTGIDVKQFNDALSVSTLQDAIFAITCGLRTQVALATELFRPEGENECLQIPALDHLASMAASDKPENDGESNCDDEQA